MLFFEESHGSHVVLVLDFESIIVNQWNLALKNWEIVYISLVIIRYFILFINSFYLINFNLNT